MKIRHTIIGDDFLNCADSIVSIISTFLGFLLAILGERIYDAYKDRKVGNELTQAFITELTGFVFTINKVSIDDTVTWINPIKMPIWEGAVSTNKISLLRKYDWFSNLLSLYDEVRDYNEWHHLRTVQYCGGHDVSSISIVLSRIADDLKDIIEVQKEKMR